MAIVLVAGLLLAFVHVLQAGVAQGTLRRQTALERDHARWTCARLAQRQARADCQALLPGSPGSPGSPGEASPPPPAIH